MLANSDRIKRIEDEKEPARARKAKQAKSYFATSAMGKGRPTAKRRFGVVGGQLALTHQEPGAGFKLLLSAKYISGGVGMTLEQASLVAQIVSAGAVIASLIFVGVQLKQASAAIRGASSEAHAALYTQLVQSIIDNADFARIWSVGLTDPKALCEDEWVRFVAYSSALFRQYETSRVQWQKGRLDNEHWHTVEKQATNFQHMPGLKAAWKVRGHWYSPDFRDWFESLDATETPPTYGRD